MGQSTAFPPWPVYVTGLAIVRSFMEGVSMLLILFLAILLRPSTAIAEASQSAGAGAGRASINPFSIHAIDRWHKDAWRLLQRRK